METTLIIKINWWVNEGENNIPNEHQEILTQHAEERIYVMRKEFYTGGELNYEIDGIYYNGYWEFSENKTI